MDAQIQFHPLEELLDFEEKRYGINHRIIGEAALRFWRLPDSIIVCQRSYKETYLNNLSPLAYVCEIARRCAGFICYKESNWRNLYIESEGRYKIRHEILNDSIVEVFNIVETFAESLKIKIINRQNDIGILVEKAKESPTDSNRLLTSSTEKILPPFQSLKATSCDPIVSNTFQAIAHEIRIL